MRKEPKKRRKIIDRIVDKQMIKKKQQYKVKWKGYSSTKQEWISEDEILEKSQGKLVIEQYKNAKKLFEKEV